MITFMCNTEFFKHTIVITNRKLVKGDFLEQIKKIAALSPKAILLREKDLSREEYKLLAKSVQEICEPLGTGFMVHSDIETAIELGCTAIHLSSSALAKMSAAQMQKIRNFSTVSVACHSIEDVRLAMESGATQIILGTIFETDCKKGLKGKGTEFVREICDFCKTIDVYAIGGIDPTNIQSVIDAGAAGGCMMSFMMKY